MAPHCPNISLPVISSFLLHHLPRYPSRTFKQTPLGQVSYTFSQAGQTFKQLQPAPGHTANHASSIMGSNVSRETVVGTNLTPTLPPSPLAVVNFSTFPSDSKAHQYGHIDVPPPVEAPRYSVQGTAAGGVPPSSFYNEVVGNSVQAQTSIEQVEDGRTTRQQSLMSTLPPYSPGEFQLDDDVPPLPD